MEWFILYAVCVVLTAVYTYGAWCYVCLEGYLLSKKRFREEESFIHQVFMGLLLIGNPIIFWCIFRSYKWTNPWGEDL